jgi:hypothetical protein
MKRQPYLSVCIPTYEMRGLGAVFLVHSLNILAKQSFKDFNVVISDYSVDTEIKKVCERFKNTLNIKYVTNDNHQLPLNKRMSGNTNNAILHADGKLIKILFLDDFLYDKNSLKKTVESFEYAEDHWLISASEHSSDGKTFNRPYYPKYNDKIYLGKNTISSPSVLTIKNDSPLLFDENLIWLMDCDYYKRCYEKFGAPKILNEITVVNRVGQHQISNNEVNNDLIKQELRYVKEKFDKKKKLQLNDVTIVAVTSIDPAGAIKALESSMNDIDFHQAVLITKKELENINPGITVKICDKDDLQSKDPKNTDDYSKFMAYKLWKYIESEYALIVHNDAYVVRPEEWKNEFLYFDYIGAPWPKNTHFTKTGKEVRVGNGGFSLRSRKLLHILNDLKLPFTDSDTGYHHEDGILCVYYREELEKAGIKFAPVEVATRFSGEVYCEDSYLTPFGYHNNPKFLPLRLKIMHWLKQIKKRI